MLRQTIGHNTIEHLNYLFIILFLLRKMFTLVIFLNTGLLFLRDARKPTV